MNFEETTRPRRMSYDDAKIKRARLSAEAESSPELQASLLPYPSARNMSAIAEAFGVKRKVRLFSLLRPPPQNLSLICHLIGGIHSALELTQYSSNMLFFILMTVVLVVLGCLPRSHSPAQSPAVSSRL
jgi:hypothetical protein